MYNDKKNITTGIFAICVWLLPVWGVQAQELSLEEAEQLALQNDPLVASFQATAQAAMEEAVSVKQWPDPRVRLGTMNRQLDGLGSPMTQNVIGLQQMIPPASLRNSLREQKLLQAEVARSKAMDRALTVLLQTRQAWIDVYFQVQSAALVEESTEVYRQLTKVTQFQYRSGRGKQQDVMSARLELALLEDRMQGIRQSQEVALSKLSRWLGEIEGDRVPSMRFPSLPTLPELTELKKMVEVHPRVASAQARLGASRHAVAVAQAKKRPDLMLDVSYGQRGLDMAGLPQADMVSGIVSVSVPLFAGNRQNRVINARGHDVNTAKDQVREEQRMLQAEMEAAWADWRNLGERLEMYKKTILPNAAQFAESARKAYQSRVTTFRELNVARLKQLDVNLQALRMRVERTKAHYRLMYIAGEN